MIVRDPVTKEYAGIQCDECGTMAPPAREITSAHGLRGLGWRCNGGTHICPAHQPVQAGNLDAPAPNHFDPSTRGFQPK